MSAAVGRRQDAPRRNKGVIARILPEEDMPYLPDGTRGDRAQPARRAVAHERRQIRRPISVGAHALGLYFARRSSTARPRSRSRTGSIGRACRRRQDAALRRDVGGRVRAGRHRRYIYMLKLSHLSTTEIHARSIGRTSLITAEPLGGKAQFGDSVRRMEVWALEATARRTFCRSCSPRSPTM